MRTTERNFPARVRVEVGSPQAELVGIVWRLPEENPFMNGDRIWPTAARRGEARCVHQLL
ncbi:MAG: hypothetical protein AAF458_14195 [Pseudomonadota bacterium]